MQRQKPFLNEDHLLMQIHARDNNAETREAWKDKYLRIKREKKYLWRVWYNFTDWLK